MRSLLALLVCLCVACAPGSVAPPPPHRQRLVIFHTADLHSHLFPERVTLTARDVAHGLGSVAGDTPLVGGVARLATILDAGRSHADVALTLDAGDVLEGTSIYTLSAGVPEMRILDALRVDAQALGNHDFAPGAEQLAELFRYAPHTARVAANLGKEGEGLASPWV